METAVSSHVKTGQARVSSVLEASGLTFSSRWLEKMLKKMRALKHGCLGGRQMRGGNVVPGRETDDRRQRGCLGGRHLVVCVSVFTPPHYPQSTAVTGVCQYAHLVPFYRQRTL